MGQNHARVLSTFEEVELTSVADLDMEKAAKLARQYKLNAYKSYSELLKREKIDVAIIALPTALHYKCAKETIKRNIITFLEKPITINVEQAKDLINFASRNKVPVMVGHIERFNPVVQEIKKRLSFGELGKIFQIHTQRYSPSPDRIKDVSAVVDLATHDVDIISFLIEDVPLRIYAETMTMKHGKEDIMSATIKFTNGVVGLIEVSWLHPVKIRNLNILGENGMYRANYLTQELFFYKTNEFSSKSAYNAGQFSNADVVKIAFESKEPLQIELEAFINALRTNSKMPVTAQEGLSALAMVEKFLESGRKHSIIK